MELIQYGIMNSHWLNRYIVYEVLHTFIFIDGSGEVSARI